MDNLTVKIQKYFGLVESHGSQIGELIKESSKPLNSIVNQSTIFRAIAPKDSISNSPFKHFQGFRELLYDSVLKSLEEELELLENIRDKIDAANETLYREQKSISSLYHNLKQKKLLNISELNPCCPSLEHIIDWCYDIWSYYHSFYLQISQALVNINFESEESVKILSKSFEEDREAKKHINKIKSFNLSKFEFLS